MRAGSLRLRLTIQTATEAQDAIGHPAKTWSTNIVVWGSLNPISGRERQEATGQVGGEATHVAVIRAHTNATVAARLLFGTRVFDINSVGNRDERGAEMVIRCTERV